MGSRTHLLLRMSTGSVSEEEEEEVKNNEDLENGEVEELEEPLVRVVVTQRAKEVAWPPPDEKRAISPGDLTGKVRFGQSRRKLMELEVAKFKGSSSHQMRTNPFSAGGFQPGKMKADKRCQWSLKLQDATRHKPPEERRKRSLARLETNKETYEKATFEVFFFQVFTTSERLS